MSRVEHVDEQRSRRPSPSVYPGWGEAQGIAFSSLPMSDARTVQVMGVYSLLLLPLLGIGVPLAVATLLRAGRARGDLVLAGGRGPGGREVRVGIACARAALALAGCVVALWAVLVVTG